VTWFSLAMAVAAVSGMTGSLIYLRIALRDASCRRSVDQLFVACTAAALLGFGLATWECVSSGQCFTPQRAERSQWDHAQLAPFGRAQVPARP
jgi:hypothetical protein